jgi:pimeloyl-ACP methyl ester carboxylesterase
MSRLIFLALISVCGFPSCTTVKIQIKPDAVTEEGITAARQLQESTKGAEAPLSILARVGEARLREARRLESRGKSDDAAACYLKTAVEARKLLAAHAESPNPAIERILIDFHNRSLARFSELWADAANRQGHPGALRLTYGEEIFEVTIDEDSDFDASFFDRVIATDSISGKGVVEKKRDGYGATLVGVREKLPGREEEFEFYLDKGLFLPVTLTLESPIPPKDGRESPPVTRVPISLRNPLLQQTVSVGQRQFPLAANYSAPLEVLLDGDNEFLEGLGGFIKAEKRREESGMFLSEPYDPNRIPVILTHGLVSVPIIWRDLIPQMLSDSDLASRYQFIVFTYPSSYYVVESAHLFRTELAKLRAKYDPDGNDPLSNNIVAMGHSMGGVLTHMAVAEVGDTLWNQVGDVPIEDLKLDPATQAKLHDLVFFEADPGIKRVVFMATPHRGARLAEASFANLLSGLARLPTDVLNPTRSILTAQQSHLLKIKIGKRITSVQSLHPNSPISKTLELSPYKPGVIYHSIIGDRGRGDILNSSDGVVEYWSSHQDGAATELIVPTGHKCYAHPNSVAEIRRLLRAHVGLD